jgi:hypothetical protein
MIEILICLLHSILENESILDKKYNQENQLISLEEIRIMHEELDRKILKAK